MDYSLTELARRALEERGIRLEWVERVLREPTRTEAEPGDPSLQRRYCAISEYGDRVLRVVVNTSVEPVRVVSVFFDRGMRGKL